MISVIIPTCNRNELLSKCLDKLTPEIQSTDINLYETIITDDSKNNTAKTLIVKNYPWVKWVEGAKKGPAANRNNGARYAKGEWLVFIDDDCLPDKNLINTYTNAINKYQDTKVFEGCIKAERPKLNFIEEAPLNEKGGNLWSCNFMISASIFRKLNGFDPIFPYPAMEDVDLHYRIKKLNERIQFIADAFVIHPWRIEKNILFKTKKRFQSTLYFLKKHPEMIKTMNAAYFFKYSIIDFKNIFKYAFKFKFQGVKKQFILSLIHFYYAVFLLFKKI